MSSPPASAPPNLLFLFPDQWRWDWLGCEDSPFGKVPVNTPHVDALAECGVRFTQCRTNSPVCAPARACLATGRRYHRCGVPGNGYNLPLDRPTVFKLLRDAGYRVAVTGKPDLQKHGQWKGLDGWTRTIGQLGFSESLHQAGKWDAVNSGADRPQDAYMAHLHREGLAATHAEDYRRRHALRSDREAPVIDPSPTPLPREHYTDDFCGRSALSFLERWAVGEPWCLWVNFPGPHEPFDPPAELLRRYDCVRFPDPVEPATGDAHDHQALRRSYAAMIEGIDEWVGRLTAALEQRGELANTLIVFSSDHGEMLGDHGRWYKSTPDEASVHVPLIVAGPEVHAGKRNDALVELIDLSATLLDFAGLPTPADWDARSLRPQLTGKAGPASHRDVQVSALANWRLICDGRHKLIETADKPARLFDLGRDPAEMHDLAATQPERVQTLHDRLERELASNAETPPVPA